MMHRLREAVRYAAGVVNYEWSAMGRPFRSRPDGSCWLRYRPRRSAGKRKRGVKGEGR
jgi:hypothetical protein